jgi:hypothetical protein
MVVDCESSLPTQSPQLPLKRSRSPNDGNSFDGDGHREEKRVKKETAADDDLDEIARMVQAVQASVMKEFLSAPESHLEPEPEPKPGLELKPADRPHIEQPDEVFETTEQEHINIESALESALEATLNQQRSPSRDAEVRPDTLWNNPRYYTRRKHIIPALGALVSGSSLKVMQEARLT